MNKDLKNKAWQCLPAEFRKEVREMYARTENDPDYEHTAITLHDLFGHENLKPSNGAIGTILPATKLHVESHVLFIPFVKGDKAKVIKGKEHYGEIGMVTDVEGSMVVVRFSNGDCVVWHNSYFAPYTEENKETMEEKELGKEDNFPTKELTLSDEELDKIIFELIRIRDNRRENDRQLRDALLKFHEQNAKQ